MKICFKSLAKKHVYTNGLPKKGLRKNFIREFIKKKLAFLKFYVIGGINLIFVT